MKIEFTRYQPLIIYKPGFIENRGEFLEVWKWLIYEYDCANFDPYMALGQSVSTFHHLLVTVGRR